MNYYIFMLDGSDLPKLVQDLNKATKEIAGEVLLFHISDPSSDIIKKIKEN